MMREPGLVLANVSFGFGTLVILDGQSFEIPKGELRVVTGKNGIGKSTFLYLCAGLLSPDAGSIALAGRSPDPVQPSSLFRVGVRCGVLFQNAGLMANQTAHANVSLALRYHADLLGLSGDAIEDRTRSALAEVGVHPSDQHALPAQLSFGERKLVGVARLLALDPNFVFFDDPDSGLDAETAERVDRIILRYQQDPNVTVLVTTTKQSLVERLGVGSVDLIGGRLIPSPASNGAS